MPSIPQPSAIIKCTDISSCFQSLYNFFFALLIALAFLNFLYGAFQYLISAGGVFSKEEGKRRMINSVLAVIIALSVPIILNMINPEIFKAKLYIPQVTVKLPSYKMEPGYLPGGGTPVALSPILLEQSNCTHPQKEICRNYILNSGYNLDPTTLDKLSLVCAHESGGDPGRESSVDKCQDGNSFSIGLFQINMAVRDLDEECKCADIFGQCYRDQSVYTCRIQNYALYEKCKNKLKDPSFNISWANRISTNWLNLNAWSVWRGIRDKCFSGQ